MVTKQPGVLTLKTLAVFALVTLPVFVGVVFVIGHFAARPHTGWFDWELAAIVGTALGTMALAIATGALAYTTTGDVRATWELAELQRKSSRASIKPIVTNAPVVQVFFSRASKDEEGSVTIPFRNVGAGAAVIQGEPTMHWDEPQAAETPTTYYGTVNNRVVPPDEYVEVRFEFGNSENELRRIVDLFEMGRFWVTLSYTDSVGDQAESTRIDIRGEPVDGRTQHRRWTVQGVSLRREGEDDYYVVSGRRAEDG